MACDSAAHISLARADHMIEPNSGTVMYVLTGLLQDILQHVNEEEKGKQLLIII